MDSLPPEAADKLFAAAAEAGVTRADLLPGDGETALLTSEALCALYERASRFCGDPAFGLHVGERTSPRMYGLLGYVTAHSSTFGEALASLVAFQGLWSDAVAIELNSSRRHVRLTYRHRAAIPAERRRQESEQMMAAFLVFAREVLASPVHPVEVRFEHRAPPDTSEHRRLFDCRLRFGAPATELLFDLDLLARPLPRADPDLLRLIREQAGTKLARRMKREPLVARVEDRLRAAILASRERSLAEVAAELALGPRTLQRRLRERGLSFREAADRARFALARELLAGTGLPLAQIAFQLGYSQPSAFHRAFRRLGGTTPLAYRRSASP
jgi:AraC-like DNA-binding protein